MSDQGPPQLEPVARPPGETAERTGMMLADVIVRAAMERLLERAEPQLADVMVRAAMKVDAEGAPADKQAGFGSSLVILTANENLDRLLRTVEKDVADTAPGGASRHDLDATQQTLGGESDLDPDTVARLLRLLALRDKDQPKTPGEMLTPRQLDVLKLLARGQTNREIAQELVLSPGTVRTHVQRIIAKLGASDRTGAVVRAIELGHITPESSA